MNNLLNELRAESNRQTMKKYNNAGSKGLYIDKLREEYPFRICRASEPEYEAVLCGVQPLVEGEKEPIYRFPGGQCVVNPFSAGIKIIEW